MAKEKFIEFSKANEYVVNKDKAITSYIKYMLSRTQAMFSYTGLPETIPATALEYILQTEGCAFITEVEGKPYALTGSLGGETDVYGDFTQITVANTALKLTKTYDLEKDGVLMNSDTLRMGLLPILQKYGALLTENTVTIHTVDIMLRMSAFISASDDKTYRSAEKFITDIVNGKISAIGESAFFDGVKIQSVPSTQNYMTQFTDLEQYLKASCWNEIGLNGNYNMKREYIGNAESALNDDLLLPLVDNMIKERQTAINKINEKYGTEISIDFASSWKVTHVENEKEVALAESVVSEPDLLNVKDGENNDKSGNDGHSEIDETGTEGLNKQIGEGNNAEESIHELQPAEPEEPAETANEQPHSDDEESDKPEEGKSEESESESRSNETDSASGGENEDDEK